MPRNLLKKEERNLIIGILNRFNDRDWQCACKSPEFKVEELIDVMEHFRH